MKTIATEFLFGLDVEVETPPIRVGQTPLGTRVIANITGGSFEGPRLRGRVLRSGADWAVVHSDGSLTIDVRLCLETEDSSVIYMSYGGRMVVPPELMAQIVVPESGSPPDPGDFYFRTNPLFETGAAEYAWLNSVVAIGTGWMTPHGVAYDVFAVK
jgi:hypothetical protein